jgi:protein TonB
MTGAPSLDMRESAWRAMARWGACFAAAIVVHGVIGASLLSLSGREDQGGPPPAPIFVDLADAATPMASIEDVSKLIPEPDTPEPPPPVPNPVLDMLPTPEPPPEVKIEVALEIPPPEPPPPVDLKPPPPVAVPKPLPKPPEKKVVTRRAEPWRAPPSAAPTAPTASGAPSPAPSVAAPQPNPRAVAAWQGTLLAHLARHKRYPRTSQDRGDQGVVHLRFTMTRQGRVLAQRIERTSGHAPLDAEALDLIQRAQPLPAPPADMPGEQFDLLIPIQFSLR